MRVPTLVIVRRDEKALYWSLRRAYSGTAAVLLDWRCAARRREAQPVSPDRRLGDRRVPLSAGEAQQWEDTGFLVRTRDVGVDVYEAEHRLGILR